MNCCEEFTGECMQGRHCPVRTTTITANAAQPEAKSNWQWMAEVLFAIVLVFVVICLSGWIGYYLNFN